MFSLLLVSILPKFTLVYLPLLLLHLMVKFFHGIKHKNGLLISSLTPYAILHIKNLISVSLHTLPCLPMLIHYSIELESTQEWPLCSLFKSTRHAWEVGYGFLHLISFSLWTIFLVSLSHIFPKIPLTP